MSLTLSGDLQAAIYTALSNDSALVALVGTEIYDAPLPSGGNLPEGEHVTLGEEISRPFNSATSRGSIHDLAIFVHSTASGFSAAKEVVRAIGNVLDDANLPISGGHMVRLQFLRARARRGVAPELRRIELRFRAVLEEN